MELQPPTAPLPPFWAAVRRRHRDVDIVLLPVGEPRRLVDDVDDGAVLAAVERVDTALDALGDALGVEPAAAANIGYGPDPGTVVPRARLVSHRGDGCADLDRLRGRLEEQGWSVRRPAGGVARLVGHRAGLHVWASYAEETGGLLLDVSGDPLHVGDARARRLASP